MEGLGGRRSGRGPAGNLRQGAQTVGAERDWAGEAEAAGAEVGAGADWGR